MIVVALVAVALNTVISLWLRGEAKHDLNIRSAYLPDTTLAAATEMALVAITVFLAQQGDSGRHASVSFVANTTGLSRRTVRRRLGDLARRGYVQRDGRGWVMGAGYNLRDIRHVMRRHIEIIDHANAHLDALGKLRR